jgi:hypothetical protein
MLPTRPARPQPNRHIQPPPGGTDPAATGEPPRNTHVSTSPQTTGPTSQRSRPAGRGKAGYTRQRPAASTHGADRNPLPPRPASHHSGPPDRRHNATPGQGGPELGRGARRGRNGKSRQRQCRYRDDLPGSRGQGGQLGTLVSAGNPLADERFIEHLIALKEQGQRAPSMPTGPMEGQGACAPPRIDAEQAAGAAAVRERREAYVRRHQLAEMRKAAGPPRPSLPRSSVSPRPASPRSSTARCRASTQRLASGLPVSVTSRRWATRTTVTMISRSAT